MILSKGIGIDLGTTNSAVAVMDPTDTEVVMYRHETTNSPLTASCVWRDPGTGEVVVGRRAFQRKGTMPEPVSSIKRQMGRETTVDLSGEPKTPAEISAYILEELVGQITGIVEGWNTDESRWAVERGIVTIPAYFKQPAVEATHTAAKLAGLELIELLHEPTAAATYYCWARDLPDGVFMVYDLGGGTFDVSILKRTAGEFDVLGISGNNFLGGDDFDSLLAQHMIELLSEDYALDLDLKNSPDDRLIFTQLRMLAEGVKKQLSNQGEVLVRDSMIADQNGARMIVEMVIERATFEALIGAKVAGTIDVCHEAVEKAREKGGVSLSDVDEILLVGGSTYIPLVRQVVTEGLCASPDAEGERARCKEPIQDGPDTCVAMGAAVRAAIHGLDAWDDGRTGRIRFRGQASTTSSETGVTGEVAVFAEDVDLGTCCVELVSGDFRETVDLSEQGGFRFRDVPLEQSAATVLGFAVYDADDNCVLAVGREMLQSARARSMGGASTGSVLAEAFTLDVRSQGRLEKRELVETGTALPARARHRFAHPGGGIERLRLTLHHGAIKVKDVYVDVDPATPEGTPIDMDVHLDQNYLITIHGTIGEQPFTAQVVPPPPPEPPTEEDIARWREAFSQARESWRPVQAVQAEAEFDSLIDDMRQAMTTGDDARSVARKQELEARMALWQQGPVVLDPPWERFEALRQEVLNLVARAEQQGIERFDADATRRWIDDQTALAKTAWDSDNQVQYGQAWEDLLERGHFVRGLLESEPERVSPSEQAAGFVGMLERDLREVRELARARNITDHDEKLDQIGEELSAMRARCAVDPEHVVTDCRRINQELDVIRGRLQTTGPGDDDVPLDP